jgi:hypothetical protein
MNMGHLTVKGADTCLALFGSLCFGMESALGAWQLLSGLQYLA